MSKEDWDESDKDLLKKASSLNIKTDNSYSAPRSIPSYKDDDLFNDDDKDIEEPSKITRNLFNAERLNDGTIQIKKIAKTPEVQIVSEEKDPKIYNDILPDNPPITNMKPRTLAFKKDAESIRERIQFSVGLFAIFILVLSGLIVFTYFFGVFAVTIYLLWKKEYVKNWKRSLLSWFYFLMYK